MTPLPTH